MAKKTEFLKLSPKDRSERIQCIRKFFLNKLPELRELGEKPKLREVIGGDINSLGVEGALEACIGLFEDGRLRIIMKDLDNFVIFTMIGEREDEPMLIYEEGEI